VIRVLRFAVASWLVYAPLALHPGFDRATLAALWGQLPELTVAALVGERLPVVVGLACLVRWLRARPPENRGTFAVATRVAAVLAILGLLLPLHSEEAADPAASLAYRAGLLLALLLTIDGSFRPAAGRASGPRGPGRSVS
jgi:hypothetical protein